MNIFKKYFKKSDTQKEEKKDEINKIFDINLENIIMPKAYGFSISETDEPKPEKIPNKTKEVLKKSTVIKNEEGYSVSVEFLLNYLNNEVLPINEQIKIITKLLPYMEHKKSGFDKLYKKYIYSKYVIEYLVHKPILAEHRVSLLKHYNVCLSNAGKTPDEIYKIDLAYFTDKTSLDYIIAFISIGNLVGELSNEYKLRFFNEHFEEVSALMESRKDINQLKFEIYSYYTELLIENGQLDKAFVLCRKTEHDILYNKLNNDSGDYSYINEFDAFINVYTNKAIICYKENLIGDCLYHFLQCIMLQYCSRNIDIYNYSELNKEDVKRYGDEDKSKEYEEKLNHYTLSEASEWMTLIDNIKLKDLILLYPDKKLDYDSLNKSMQDYVQNTLFKTYHNKLIWIHKLSEFSKSLLL